jgi:hypothetical protein
VADISPECWDRYLKCMVRARDNVSNRCTKACRAKFGNDIEGFKSCIAVCPILAQAAYDDCLDELDKCAGRDPRERQRWEERQKQVFNTNANSIRTFGGITLSTGLTIGFAAAAANLPAAWVGCGLGVAALGAGLFITAAYAIEKASEDPIDNNFKSLARPRPPEPYIVKAKPGTAIDADVANALNAVLENQANAIGLDRAIMTSINRAQGAAVAKESTYEKLQMKNARGYAGKLAIVLRESAGLRSKAASKLRKNGVVFSITEDQAYNIREILVEKVVPSNKFKTILSRYCMNAAESKKVERRFLAQLADVHQLEVTFPNVLSNPKLASAESKIASSLEEFSKSTYISL